MTTYEHLDMNNDKANEYFSCLEQFCTVTVKSQLSEPITPIVNKNKFEINVWISRVMGQILK